MRQAVAQANRTGETICVQVLDLEPDATGAGDEADGIRFRATFGRIADLVRQCDAAIDYGQGRFAVLQRAVPSYDGALLLAHRLLECGAGETSSAGSRTGAAVGLCFHEAGDPPEELLLRASRAVNEARGKAGRICCWGDPSFGFSDAIRRYARLRKALEQREFVLEFEPQICLETGRLVAFESLIRWRHPRHGVIAPDAFIPLAESSGMIFELGEWVLSEACQRCRDWAEGPLGPVPVAVNVSALQLSSPAFPRCLAAILDRTGLPANLLELELTETACLQETATARATLHDLKQSGVRLVLDDFGTGYSSFQYLDQVPADKIKIPKEFVREASRKGSTSRAVEAIAVVGHRLGLDIVAEGVETPLQHRSVHAAGCHAAQGYLYTRSSICSSLAMAAPS